MIEVTITNGEYNINGDISAILKYREIHNSLVKVICNPPLEADVKQLMDNVCEYINTVTNFAVRTNHVTTNISMVENKISELTFQILW